MKKGIYLFSTGLLLLTSFPLTAFGEENTSPETMVESTENQVEVEIIHHEEAEIVEEVPLEESIEEASFQPENVVETASLEAENSEATENKEETQTIQTRAISPELGITIPEYDGKLVDKENTITDIEHGKVTSEYAFMPQITDKTEVIVTGNYISENEKYRFELADNQQGKISITYKNVGMYNGKVIDLKVSFDDWTLMEKYKQTLYSPYLELTPTSTSVLMHGLRSLTANYFFLDTLTGLNTSVSGFFNFTDVDNNQYLDIYNNANIKNFYAIKDNVLYYKDNGDFISIGDYFGKDANDNVKDKNYWLTYTYDKTSQFTIVFNELREGINAYSALFDYTYEAPVVIEPQKTKVAEEGLVVMENKNQQPLAMNTTYSPPVAEKRAQALLPQTGEKNQPLLFLIGAILLSFVFIFYRKEQKMN